MRRTAHRLAARAALAGALAGWACASAPPPPDPDGEPGRSTEIRSGTQHRDQLHCAAGDCADWFRIRAPDAGRLELDASAQAGAVVEAYDVQLHDGRNQQIATAERLSAGQRGLVRSVEPGYYLIGVRARPGSAPIPYELAVRFAGAARPRPPPDPMPLPEPAEPEPPEPAYEVVRAELLEVEGSASSPEAVVISEGRRAGIAPGMRGRLIANGSPIATIEVTDTYEDGSRARIEGYLRSTITPDTVVEIDRPLFPGEDATTDGSDAGTARPF